MNNETFINTIFGADSPRCHVTDFIHDPSNIPSQREHLIAWKGDYYSKYQFHNIPSNQYFTISVFHPDEKGVARRRKALFDKTYCIVLDDVKEKLVQSEVDKLPTPSWILESSIGSEQWGYILVEPCSDRSRVENLLDGLIANGLAPDGKDSGMKGVTRYVRLPDGYNNKKKKLVDGQPFKCRMLAWNPFNKVTMEQLAEPLKVNLDAPRRENNIDGASDVPDHPLLHIEDIVTVKEVRSDGRFDITCPWVHEHTGQEDSGSAIFTNEDGSFGFKCHHGNCQDKTGKDLIEIIETEHQGFKAKLANWQVMRQFSSVTPSAPESAPVVPVVPESKPDSVNLLVSSLRKVEPRSPESRTLTSDILKVVENLPVLDRQQVYDDVRDIHRWSKTEFKQVLAELRKEWYKPSDDNVNFFDDVVYIAEVNQFYDRIKRMFYSPESYQNSYAHLDPDARKEALQGGQVTKVDKLDFAPKMPSVFELDGITYANSWNKEDVPDGVQGDASPWLDHIDRLGWGQHKKHLLQWMAYTMRYPETKINHMIILGSNEGSGKDFILAPLIKAMGRQCRVINGEQLTSDFNPYLLSTKYLHINEAELSDKRDAQSVSNKLKPLSANPPWTLTVNDKGVKTIDIRNIVNCSMTTNSQLPIKLNGPSRRMFCLWSDFDVRDASLNMPNEWKKFWKSHWDWMNNGGAEYCIYHLMNNIDLSDFDAGSPPPVTDFLREMIEASKSPVEMTIESLVAEGQGVFGQSLLTADDIVAGIHMASEVAPHHVYIDANRLTPNAVVRVMNKSYKFTKFRTKYGYIYAVRNLIKHRSQTIDEITDLYESKRPATVKKPNGTIVNF